MELPSPSDYHYNSSNQTNPHDAYVRSLSLYSTFLDGMEQPSTNPHDVFAGTFHDAAEDDQAMTAAATRRGKVLELVVYAIRKDMVFPILDLAVYFQVIAKLEIYLGLLFIKIMAATMEVEVASILEMHMALQEVHVALQEGCKELHASSD
ncbi:hypothetical protein QYF36_021857 [Acer negundo]|nr:hypothetical protein QYF36_021857 [Acer negundo]